MSTRNQPAGGWTRYLRAMGLLASDRLGSGFIDKGTIFPPVIASEAKQPRKALDRHAASRLATTAL